MTAKPSYEELERRLNQSNAILEKVNNGIVIFEVKERGADFIFKYVNKAVETIENVKKTDIIGRSVIEVFPGIIDLGLLDVFRRVWTTGEAEHYPTTLYKDERICGFRKNHVSKLSDDEIVAVYTDETERQKSENSLRESEHFYKVFGKFCNTCSETLFKCKTFVYWYG